MTRVEINNSQGEQNLQPKQKSFFNCLSCGLIFLIVIILVIASILSLIAKTGVVNIPFFSAIFYDEPLARRQVIPEKIDLENIFLNEFVQTGDNQVSVTLNEAQASYLLNEFLKSEGVSFSEAQIAFDDQNSELYIKFLPTNTIFRSDFKIESDDGLRPVLIKNWIGNFQVPGFLNSMMQDKIDQYFEPGQSVLNNELVEIQDILVKDQNAEIKLNVNYVPVE